MERESLRCVVAGNMLANDAQIITQPINDVLDSLLYPQLMADDKANRFKAPQAWFQAYRSELMSMRWTGTASNRNAFEPEAASQIVLFKLIEEHLLNELSDPHAREVGDMLDSILALPQTDEASLLVHEHAFERALKAQDHSSIALQVSILEKPTVLSSLFLTFKTADTIEWNPLHQVFAGDSIVGEVEAYFFQRRWDPAGYEGKRASVNRFLAEKREGKILYVAGAERLSHDLNGQEQ